jgi:hypothetical protein
MTIPKPRKMLPGWLTSCGYKTRNGKKVFVRLAHACPDCPTDIPRPAVDSIPVCTVQEGMLEVEEASRFAMTEESDLKGSSRTLIVRALAMLDAARERLAGE